MSNQALGTDFSRRLKSLHDSLLTVQPDLDRIAVALYDQATDMVTTYAYSSKSQSPLVLYELPITQVPSLQHIAAQGSARLIPDMSVLSASPNLHTKVLLDAGFRTSYTSPILYHGRLLGFVFFNAITVDAFSTYILPQLDTTAYAISLLVIHEKAMVSTLRATMKSAIDVTHERNPETGEHLQRLTSYTRIIAQGIAEQLGLTDEFIEHLALFSALHDIGKISIPDSVLLKPGKLNPNELAIMRSHTTRGRTLIDTLIKNHALEHMDHIEVLRNIVELHHEHWDGNGYPHGLQGEAIPIEARIVAVSDVFDALTSKRIYKKAMTNEQAFELLSGMAGKELDPQCLAPFILQSDKIMGIRNAYAEKENA